ncbi:ATP synthase F1 subunit delta [Planctomicrobium piriforme]|uniref:ATP synthase subunit delta n=1 Tax=Planctomicrobium piriforme TaxID=1576369 RepID=A0A1I3S464_9PLAN|nr:ATP synthase F1 subunit delta [Planctomicrobium piriforme]SFJ53455.1 F-type H+-transporting ATPase subunit delta [Planctomicrobium piriforme]
MSDATLPTRPAHVLEDPSSQAVARVYALAYLNAAQAAGEQQPLDELTSFQDDVLSAHPQLAYMLTTEMLTNDQKLGILQRTVQNFASPMFANFLKVLAEHDRLSLFSQILREAWIEYERRAGKKRIQVKSAVPLNDEQLSSIKNRIQSALNLEPVLIPVVDPELIGGLVIQVGDTVYDGSLKTRLKNLRQRLQKGYLYEIQSGRDRFSNSEGN